MLPLSSPVISRSKPARCSFGQGFDATPGVSSAPSMLRRTDARALISPGSPTSSG
jgi:hypothetical protein